MNGDGRRLRSVWEYINTPKRLTSASFDNYYPKEKSQQKALDICRSYGIEQIQAGIGLFLFGPVGTGKSHLTVSTVRNLVESNVNQFGVRLNDSVSQIFDSERIEYSGIYCSFFPVMELLDIWRPGSNAKKQQGDWLFLRAKSDDLVILDDIGAEKATEWTGDRLYAVIDARYRTNRATIFTTNCSERELQDNGYGRIVSRIYEMTEQVPVIGPDHRRKMA